MHHKIYLTPENIGKPEIALNPELLELLCDTCHALEHEGKDAVGEGLVFTADGDIVEVKGK